MKHYNIVMALLGSAMIASAQITYLDATSGATGNTKEWNGSAYGTFSPSSASSGTDGFWRLRTGLATSSSVFESAGATGGAQNTEDAKRLATTITGLTPGQNYRIYAFFWNAGSPNVWRIQADLTDPGTATPLTLHTTTSTTASLASTGTYVSNPLFTEADRILYRAVVGNKVADANGELVVYIDDETTGRQTGQNPTTSSLRTWYDGVGYEIAVPQFTLAPTSAVAGQTLTFTWTALPPGSNPTLNGNPVTIDASGNGGTTLPAPTVNTTYTLNWTGAAAPLTQEFTVINPFVSVTPESVAVGNTPLTISWNVDPAWDENPNSGNNTVVLRYGSPASFGNSTYIEIDVTSGTNATTGAGTLTSPTIIPGDGETEYRIVYYKNDLAHELTDTITLFDAYFEALTTNAPAAEVREHEGFASGTLAFTDRTHTWVDVPSALVGGHFLRLRQNDRNNAALSVAFDADPGTTVFVLVDNRVGDNVGGVNPIPGSDNPPVPGALPWLATNGFLDSGLDVGLDEFADTQPGINNTASVFFKQIPTGAVAPATSFTLGAMDGVGASPPGRFVYGVVISKPPVVPVSFHAYVGSYDLSLASPPVTSSTLFWTLPTDATGVTIDSAVGSVPIDSNGQGNVVVSPTTTTTYTLTASSVSNGPISLQTTVTVIPPLAGFGTWITGDFGGNTVPSGQQGATDDPDNDGLVNLVEFAVAGGDPTRSTASPAVLSGTLVTFNKNTEANGITYALEKSSTLANDWVPATPTTNDANVITYTLAPPTPSKEFVRLVVTETP